MYNIQLSHPQYTTILSSIKLTQIDNSDIESPTYRRGLTHMIIYVYIICFFFFKLNLKDVQANFNKVN